MWNKLFFLAILFLPFQFALGGAVGFDIAAERVVIVGIFLLWIAESLRNRRIVFPSNVSLWIPTAFLAVAALSLTGAEYVDWGRRKWLFLANMFLWYFVMASLFAQKKLSVEEIAKALAWAGGAAAAIAIGQFLLQYAIGLEAALEIWRETVAPIVLGTAFSESVNEFSSWLVGIVGETVFRAVGFFPDPHMLAFFLELTLPWAIFLTLREKKMLYGALSTVILIGIFLTFSRGAYLGLFIGGGIAGAWLLFQKKKIKFSSLVVGTSLCSLFLAAMFIVQNPVRDRLFASLPSSDSSTEGRLFLWNHALGVFSEHPLLGVGLGNYAPTLEPSADYRSPITAHNTYLDIAVEMGAGALLAWLALLALSMRGYAKALKKDILYGAGIVSLSMFSVHAFFDTALFSVHVVPALLVIVAIGMAAQVRVKSEE